MGDFNVNATILFAIMGFQGLLVVTMLVAVLRLSSVVGRLEGRIDGIWEELRNIRQEVAGLREQVAGLREQVAGRRIAGCCGRCTSGWTWCCVTATTTSRAPSC